MSVADGAAEGLTLLSERVEQAPEFVARVPEILAELLERPALLPRSLVVSGIGTSEGHARHFAEVAARWLGQPARFAATSSLSAGAPPNAEFDWLVVFSQGLSANARYALRDVEAWAGVLLVTGLPLPSDPEFAALEDEKRTWLEALADRGVVQIDMGCGVEYGALLRVIGARVGYAVGWSLLRTLAARQLRKLAALECDPDRLLDAQRSARLAARRVFPSGVPVHPFFEESQTILIVAEAGLLELASQLSLKVSEGLLRPAPACVDVLHFAHGPLQSLVGRATSILYLTEANTEWLPRFRATLDPELQDLRVFESTLPAPFSALEYEAMFDDLILRVVEERELDLVDWPGRDREASLYERGPDAPAGSVTRLVGDAGLRGAIRKFDEAVWTEIGAALESGQRTALLGLGSIEQHGPHLPLGTDQWIAGALAEGLAMRIDEAIALPAIPLGCASEHLDFPGTLSIDPETLERMLGDVLTSLARHGFERVFIWTAHGGNVDALEAMRARLVARVASLEIVVETDLDRVASMQAEAVRSEGLDPNQAGPHAGEYETSLVAALRPGTVRREALARGRMAPAEEAQSLFYPSLRGHAPQGVIGDPTQASADRGKRYLDAWLDLLEASYRSAFETPPEKNRQ